MSKRPTPPVLRGNMLDRLITAVSPQRGLTRLNARMQLFSRGAFTGASRDEKALREYRTRLGSADTDSIGDLPTLRSRSRDMVRNNPLAGGAVATNVRNVIGTGLIPRPAPDAEALGLSPEQASSWARQAERIFWAWASSCDLERRQPFWAMQSLILNAELESGDVLTVRRYSPRKGDILGLKLQVIEADRICNPKHRMDRPNLRAGVETDVDGAVVQYHVLNHHPGDPFWYGRQEWSAVPAFSRHDGSRLALHTYRRRRPGQTRGIPYLASVILHLKQLGRFTDAELYAAVIAGMNVAAIKSSSPEGATISFEGDSEEEKEASRAAGELAFDYGAVWELAPDEEVQFLASNRPNSAFDPFVMAILRQVGAALELPLEVLVLHFTRSYSSARASLLEAWKAWRTQRDHIAYDWCQPIYEWVITEAIARGLLPTPGFLRDPLTRHAWLQCEWRGPSQGQIDPLKEVQAAKERVANAFSTRAAETAELTGGDFESNARQLARETNLLRDLGISPAAAPDNGSAGVALLDPGEEEEEEEEQEAAR